MDQMVNCGLNMLFKYISGIIVTTWHARSDKLTLTMFKITDGNSQMFMHVIQTIQTPIYQHSPPETMVPTEVSEKLMLDNDVKRRRVRMGVIKNSLVFRAQVKHPEVPMSGQRLGEWINHNAFRWDIAQIIDMIPNQMQTQVHVLRIFRRNLNKLRYCELWGFDA